MSTIARLTVAEYNRMLHAGVFDQGRRVEFIAGEIREMSPIGPEHETVVDRLARWSFRNVDDSVGPDSCPAIVGTTATPRVSRSQT